MSATRIGLLGLGAYLPERVMTNDDWSRLVDTTNEWIVSRTGIERRRWAADDESSCTNLRSIGEEGLAVIRALTDPHIG